MQDSKNHSDSKPGTRNPGATSYSLLERVKTGDPESWRRLVYLYTPLVLYWCRRVGLRTQDAEDVAQEVFKTLALKFDDFTQGEQAGSFRRWLFTITRNKLGNIISALPLPTDRGRRATRPNEREASYGSSCSKAKNSSKLAATNSVYGGRSDRDRS
jgi:hypothetical protein